MSIFSLKTGFRKVFSGRAFCAGTCLGLVGALAARVQPALAHPGEPPAPHDLLRTWNFDPLILLAVAVSGWLYLRGVSALWRQAGRGRGVSRLQVAAWLSGLLFLAAALISPLDPLAEILFSAHMVQHMLLVVVVAPLLVFGISPGLAAWALPANWRRPVGRWWQRQKLLASTWEFLLNPVTAWVLHVLALFLWHVPDFYQAALDVSWIHSLEHFTFLGTALLYWFQILRSQRDRENAPLFVPAVFSLFTLALASGMFGALITFASQPWYPGYASSQVSFGLTPLQDQQLAGAIMWVPGGIVYLLVFLVFFWRRLESAGRPAETSNPPAWFIPDLPAGRSYPGGES